MPGDILVGTASWTDPTLIKLGSFYPPDAKTPEDRLRFYARQFDLVEVDSSYYALPSIDNSQRWLQRTPEDFTFDFKAFRLFTLHRTPLTSLPKDLREEAREFATSKETVYYPDLSKSLQDNLWQRFRDGIDPLRAAGRLGYVLIQLPPWAMKNRGNLRHIEESASRLEGIRVAVEFRNQTWFKDGERRELFAFLREQDLAFVNVDEPQGSFSSVPPLWESTSPDLTVVRFHGRNVENWTKRNISAAERFDYKYSLAELEDFVPKVQGLARSSRSVHALFNNCYSDKATTNARQLAELLAFY
jgi:uncharacterized protein YecE (DUF72 family)